MDTARLTLEAERVDAGVQGAEQEQAPLTDSPEQLRTADGAIPGPLRQQRHTVTQVNAREHQRFLGRNLTGSDTADIEFTSTARETQCYYDAAVVTTSDESQQHKHLPPNLMAGQVFFRQNVQIDRARV